MLIDLLLGLATMLICLLLQLGLLLWLMRGFARRLDGREHGLGWVLGLTGGVMLALVLGNLGQVALWALLFRLLGEFADYATAFYHSAVNFATLGYGDIVMSPAHRLLGPLESINGILMIGVSSSAFLAAMQRALGRHPDARALRKLENEPK